MAKILIFAEFGKSKLKKGALELLTAAHKSGNEITVLALGSGASQLATEVGSYGAKILLACDDAKLDSYNPQLYTHIIADALKTQNPDIVLASSTMLARDVFPRVAARSGGAVVSDCTELKITGANAEVRKPLYSSKCSAAVEFTNTTQKIILMRANQLPVEAASGGAAAAVTALTLPTLDLKTIIKDVVKGASEKLDLTEANIIVSGGRGLREAASFKMLDDLANVLGATVGASRAVVDAGWVPHTMQVGQTGKTVAPTLYIAVGISGAIQHLAGMSGSKVIVAINKDPNAPIFQKATYGIVGDAFEIVPKLTEEFKKVLHG
jgi:electron transfer flavoprotein alpha subunit